MVAMMAAEWDVERAAPKVALRAETKVASKVALLGKRKAATKVLKKVVLTAGY